jgi:hypothetical protein
MTMSQLLIFAVGLLVFFMGIKILTRLLPQTKPMEFESRPSGAETFAVWLTSEDAWLDEFDVGFVDEWRCGPSFSVCGNAEFNPESDAKRATIRFHSSLKALAGTNIIGWGKTGELSTELHISLTPNVAISLLGEIRRNPKSNLHAQGFLMDSGAIKITYFSFTPNMSEKSLR